MKASREAPVFESAMVQRQQHADLTQQVLDVQQKYKAGVSGTVSLEVMNFLKNWLITRIQGAYQKYGPYLNRKGIHSSRKRSGISICVPP